MRPGVVRGFCRRCVRGPASGRGRAHRGAVSRLVASALAGRSAGRADHRALCRGDGAIRRPSSCSRRATDFSVFCSACERRGLHFVEQDDLHNSSVLHRVPSSSRVLAAAQQTGARAARRSPRQSGYECGVRVGEFGALALPHLPYDRHGRQARGRSRHRAAAVDAGTHAHVWALRHDGGVMGVPARCRGFQAAPYGTGGATGYGGYTSRRLHGAREISRAGRACRGHVERCGSALAHRRSGHALGLAETSFKFHASCAILPAADALLPHAAAQLKADDIEAVTAHGIKARGRAGPRYRPRTIHQSKFHGFVLALIALHGRAGLAILRGCVERARVRHSTTSEMELTARCDAAYPRRWMGGNRAPNDGGCSSRKSRPKGDPENTLTRPELEDKAVRLEPMPRARRAGHEKHHRTVCAA